MPPAANRIDKPPAPRAVPRRGGLSIAAGVIVAGWLVLALARPATAQTQPAAPTTPPTTGTSIHLITMGPGPAIWERYGHNAIAVIDRDRGTNLAYNYGIFDFDQSDFIIRFLKGEMRYWMEAADTVQMVGPYFQQGRDVWGQEFALPPEKAAALQAFLENNALPENKFYDYNYYADNCSTRARDAIDHVTGGEVRRQLSAIRTGRTYRWHTRIAMENDPYINFGIDFSLGPYADRELNAWDESFMPVELMRHLRGVTIDDGAGGRVALVARDRQLASAADPSLRVSDRPPRTWPAMLGIGVASGLAVLLGGRAARGRSASGRVLAAIVWAAWGLVAGVGGWYLLIMWLFTKHVAAYANENLLQASPLAITLLILGPLAAFGRARKIAAATAVALAAMSLLGLAMKLLPGTFIQQNWNTLALAVPINLALAGAMWAARDRRPGLPGDEAIPSDAAARASRT